MLKFYFIFLILLALSRIIELRRSQRNIQILKNKGAQEFYPEHYRWMVLLHTAWLIACALEAWLPLFPMPEVVRGLAIFLFILGFSLRLLAIFTLKERWTTRILVLPDQALVQGGIYRLLRHPNYWGVVLEIFAVPLIGGAWVTAIVFSFLNAILLRTRVRLEVQALGG